MGGGRDRFSRMTGLRTVRAWPYRLSRSQVGESTASATRCGTSWRSSKRPAARIRWRPGLAISVRSLDRVCRPRNELRELDHSHAATRPPLSGRQDLNLQPPRPKRGALPNCATSRWPLSGLSQGTAFLLRGAARCSRDLQRSSGRETALTCEDGCGPPRGHRSPRRGESPAAAGHRSDRPSIRSRCGRRRTWR